MDNKDMLQAMHDEGIIAVLRSANVSQALDVARACLAGGVRFIEITFSVPGADEAIRALASDAAGSAIVGAGTVIDAPQAQSAIDAGARFVVAPVFCAEVLECCAESNIPYIPGCMTPNEMFAATKAGCKVVKLFPADELSPRFIKDVHAPLPSLQIMPTGGIDLDNAASWIAAGAFALGVGGNLTKMKEDGLAGITARAQAFREQVSVGRGDA